MNKKLLKICKDLEWHVTESDNDIELEKHSPAGEDFFFSVSKDDFVKEINDYAEHFDAEEHAEMWINARHEVDGVPNIWTLIHDAYDIEDMLVELANKLNEGVKNYGKRN